MAVLRHPRVKMSVSPVPHSPSDATQAADLPLPDGLLARDQASLSTILQSPSFREELDILIQDQMKKDSSSSSLWALQRIADFLSSYGASAALPTSPCSLTTVMPINDLRGRDPGSMAKGEGLQRCKLASVYRLLDFYGWARLSRTYLTLRVSKEQDHFLVLPDGLSYSEATACSLVKVNVLGEVVEQGSTALGVDLGVFDLHAAIHSARPDVRCLLHLQTPATAAVSAMKCGLLPLSHEALLVGGAAYYSYSGCLEEASERLELQRSLGPTCKVLVLRNHGIMALGESVEEAFYIIYHVQAACQIQVSAMCSAGGEKNLILLDRTTQRPYPAGTVGWAGSTFGPMHKSRRGENEFEALMRMLDNLGYRTGYPYRFPVLRDRARARREVEAAPSAMTTLSLEWAGGRSHLRPPPHAQKQRQERTKWLNTPNSYCRVDQPQDSPGWQRCTWLKAQEVKQGSGLAIKMENPNQFVPLFTNPEEVLETRRKIREQNRQEVKWAGPQSHVLASMLSDTDLNQASEPNLTQTGAPSGPDNSTAEPPPAPEPEPPNPFSQLTDEELEEYRLEVQRKQRFGLNGAGAQLVDMQAPSPTASPKMDASSPPPDELLVVAQNGSKENQNQQEEDRPLESGMKALSMEETIPASPTAPPAEPPSKSPAAEASPCKKKKKFRTPSFLKKSKKQNVKVEA
ncbi:beta-adducin-like isoform X2 [Brienomyrus brachyistius]|uniref:beta-adducin-like isoform X2 n=1 Tax=Brienomyrus brachyistius TaxID=42636 RepID=UPI0020B1BEBB|nr:beta-adducin-like isoform X2 [Brienomyrus brachyistius]